MLPCVTDLLDDAGRLELLERVNDGAAGELAQRPRVEHGTKRRRELHQVEVDTWRADARGEQLVQTGW